VSSAAAGTAARRLRTTWLLPPPTRAPPTAPMWTTTFRSAWLQKPYRVFPNLMPAAFMASSQLASALRAPGLLVHRRRSSIASRTRSQAADSSPPPPQFAALSDADVLMRLSTSLCKNGSVGAAFVTALKNALDRNSDGVVSCDEYEMLAGRCAFVDASECRHGTRLSGHGISGARLCKQQQTAGPPGRASVLTCPSSLHAQFLHRTHSTLTTSAMAAFAHVLGARSQEGQGVPQARMQAGWLRQAGQEVVEQARCQVLQVSSGSCGGIQGGVNSFWCGGRQQGAAERSVFALPQLPRRLPGPLPPPPTSRTPPPNAQETPNDHCCG
jgi:hypothetical protein